MQIDNNNIKRYNRYIASQRLSDTADNKPTLTIDERRCYLLSNYDLLSNYYLLSIYYLSIILRYSRVIDSLLSNVRLIILTNLFILFSIFIGIRVGIGRLLVYNIDICIL